MYVVDKAGLRVVLIDFGGFSQENQVAHSYTNIPFESITFSKPSPKARQRLFTYALAVLVLSLCSVDFFTQYQAVNTDYNARFMEAYKKMFLARGGATVNVNSYAETFQMPRPAASMAAIAQLTPLAPKFMRALLELAAAETFEEGLAAIKDLDAGCLKAPAPTPARSLLGRLLMHKP
jgi:hypothetical protein